MTGDAITSGQMPMVPRTDYFGAYSNNNNLMEIMKNAASTAQSMGAISGNPLENDIGSLLVGNSLPQGFSMNAIPSSGTQLPPTAGASITNQFGGNSFDLGGGFGGVGGYGYDKLSQLYYTNPEEYYKEVQKLNMMDMNNQQALRDNQLDNSIHDQHYKEGAEFRQNSQQETISKNVASLQTVIQKNDQGHVMTEYYKLYKSVAEALIEQGAVESPKDGKLENWDDQTKKNIATKAQMIYKQTTGSLITDDIEKYGDGEFTQGLKEGLLYGIFSNPSGITAHDNMVGITGVDDRTTGDTYKRYAGIGLTGAATTVAAFRLAPAVIHGGASGTWHILNSTGRSWLGIAKSFLAPFAKVAEKMHIKHVHV